MILSLLVAKENHMKRTEAELSVCHSNLAFAFKKTPTHTLYPFI